MLSELIQAHERLANVLLNSSQLEENSVKRAPLHSLLVDLSKVVGKGSSCLTLEEQQQQLLIDVATQLPWFAPDAIAQEDTAAVLMQDDRLYLNKYYQAERVIEEKFKALADQKTEIDALAIKEKLASLPFMTALGEQVILNTQRQNLSVITGGPGTGKTTIVVRVLALLIDSYLEQGKQSPTIEVLAPTGKAAARVKESIVAQKKDWLTNLCGFDAATIEAIPETAQTVQKFLGIRPTTRKSRFKSGQFANVDIIVVDEASMLDVMLVKTLLSVISPTTRLILLGDPYQLASVEAGNVLAQIVKASNDSGNEWLAQACSQLIESHRFGSESGIGRLAAVVNDGAVDEVLAILQDTAVQDVSCQPVSEALDTAIKGYQHYASVIKAIDGINQDVISGVFEAFEQWQVFSPFRMGKYGVEGINTTIEEALALGEAESWYIGKPIMITSNDHALKLYNGDIGICLDAEGKTVCFPAVEPDEDGTLGFRFINTRILPEHQLVFAMTVHKSQGSEYAKCMLVVPTPSDNQKNLLTREILYTAITRAKTAFKLYANSEAVEWMTTNKTERMSGLFKTV